MQRVKIGNVFYDTSSQDIMPLGGLPLVSKLIELSDFDNYINKIPFYKPSKRTPLIRNSEIFRSMIGLMAQGISDYAGINRVSGSYFFKDIMQIKNLPSEETLRQRIDKSALDERFFSALDDASLNLLGGVADSFEPTYKTFIPVDLDVSPFDNSNTKKEGVGCTYKLCDGYAPMFAYLGQEGYMLGCELRNGKQHSQTGTPDFLEKTIKKIKELNITDPLVRMDSGNDSDDNAKLLVSNDLDFIVKRNPRRAKNQWIDECISSGKYIGERIDQQHRKIKIYQLKNKRMIEEKNGQILLMPDYELESYTSTLNESVEDIKEIYHQHGVCEQFHSELKTDMGIERLPSGKFKTNELILYIAMYTYNILRFIGQLSLMINQTKKEKTRMIKRKRLSTTIKDIIMIAAKYVRHAREQIIKLGYGNKMMKPISKIAYVINNSILTLA